MNVNDRFNSIIKEQYNGNQSAFAKALGVAPSVIANVVGARQGKPSYDVIEKICANANISAEWLLTGQGSMLKSDTPIPAYNRLQAPSPQPSEGSGEAIASREVSVSYTPAIGTPYYDVDFLGGFMEVYNSQVANPTCNIVVPGFERATHWCNVTGHSMEPRINHGDIIAIRKCTFDDIQYGEIYAVVLDTIRTIKILRKGSAPSRMRYVPINTTDFDEQEYDNSRIVSIFEVIGNISKFF